MHVLPLGWATDLAILERSGARIVDHGDHLVVRSPQNPTFHFGNLVVVTDAAAVDDAERWTARFAAELPAADWLAIGLVRAPERTDGWRALGLAVDVDDVLASAAPPREAPLPDGYAVRPFDDAAWAQIVARGIAENAATGIYEPRAHEGFLRARATSRRALCARGEALWLGAFAAGSLVADLGIVRCGAVARYQDVGTDAAHRGRGLASHLLGAAGRWAAGRGCARWVIVAEAESAAGRLYRRAGLAPDAGSAYVYSPPGHEVAPD